MIRFIKPILKFFVKSNAVKSLVIGLLEDYAAAVDGVGEPDENTLRHSHGLYKRSFVDARRLAQDRTGDLKRQGHSVAIGFRNLRRDIADRLYPSVEVLLDRKELDYEGDYALKWPFPEK